MGFLTLGWHGTYPAKRASSAKSAALTAVALTFMCTLMPPRARRAFRSVLTTWVELQTTVNCYMDSSKDPRGLKDTPPGLRQVSATYSTESANAAFVHDD